MPLAAPPLGMALPPFAPEPPSVPCEAREVFRCGLRHHHLANTAYPIAHRKTIWAFRQAPDAHEPLLSQALRAADPMCLYIHVPFCEQRCAYCEYAVVDQQDELIQERYVQAVEKEIDLYVDRLGLHQAPIAGLDLGGGTPMLLTSRLIDRLLRRVLTNFRTTDGFEVSIETTPKVAAEFPERLREVRSLGIARISMGLQMVNAHLLQAYSRDAGQPARQGDAMRRCREAGYDKVNVDLMYGFARQRTSDFETTLREVVGLEPDVITLYRMRYKGTRVAGEAAGLGLEEVVRLQELGHEFLENAGYQAPPGKNTFSRRPGDPGTSAYLTQRVVRGTPYLGVGLGAQTFTNNLLAYNLGAATKRLDPYLSAVAKGALPIQDLYWLPPSEGMAKMVAVSFYFGQVDLAAFQTRFGEGFVRCYPAEVAFALEAGLAELTETSFRLTRAGAAAFPGVVALFYSNRVKAHLLSL